MEILPHNTAENHSNNGHLEPDKARIQNFIKHVKRGSFAVRVLGRGDAYFDDADEAAVYAVDANKRGGKVYFVLQDVGKPPDEGSTADNDVSRYAYLPLDFDPVRFGVDTQAVPATTEEKKAAQRAMLDCRDYLKDLGFGEPIIGDSGNGYHLLYRVDLPNNRATRDLIERCLKAVKYVFEDDRVKVDTSVANPSRIWKLYGTVARKGIPTDDRPNRLSRVLNMPDDTAVNSRHMLEELAARAPKEDVAVRQEPDGYNGPVFDVQGLLDAAGVDVEKQGPHKNGYRWQLARCPWRGHDDHAAFIIQHSDGRIRAGCSHNSCVRYGWHHSPEGPERSMRKIYEGVAPEFVSVHLYNHHEQKRKDGENGGDSGCVSVHGGGLNGQNRKLPLKSVKDVIDECGDKPDWLWEGFLARGWFTDLTGPAKKAGKTTLLMHAVRHLLDGTPFLDYPTQVSKVLYLTEQSASAAEAIKNSGLDTRHENLKIIQWKDTREWAWPELVDDVFEYASEFGASLVIVDTLNKFAGLRGEEENLAGPVSQAMNPLLLAAQRHSMAVLSVRHANKEGKARGSTQFDHDVDILFEIQRADGNENMRVLEGIGRSDDVPAKLTFELTDAGYRNLGSDDKVKFKAALLAINRVVSKDADDPTPKPELEKMLQAEGVALATGRRALGWLVGKGGIVRVGEGKRGDPYAFHAVPLDASAIPEEKGA